MTSLVADGSVLARRAMIRSLRNPGSVISAIIAPLIFLGLFNVVLREVMKARGFDYGQLLPSTVVVQAMMFTGMSAAYYMADDRLTGVLSRLRSLPIHRGAPVVARAISDGLRALVSTMVVVIVGVALGMRFDAGFGWFLLFFVVAMLFAIAMSLVMGLLGYVASSPEAAVSIATMPYLPLIMLSTGFAPAEDFVGWLQPFVEHQPISATIDALRALAGDGDIGETVPIAFAWSIGMIVVFVVLNMRAMERSA